MTDPEQREDRADDRDEPAEPKSIDDLLETLGLDDVDRERSGESRFLECPRCGSPIVRMLAIDPVFHTLEPCGCRVHANVIGKR